MQSFPFIAKWLCTNLSILYFLCKANRRMHELRDNEAQCAVSNLCFCNTNRNGEKQTHFFVIWVFACHSNKIVTQWICQKSKSVDCAILMYFHFRTESQEVVVSYYRLSSLSGKGRMIAKIHIPKLLFKLEEKEVMSFSNTSFHPADGYSWYRQLLQLFS